MLERKLRRDLWRLKGQVLTIALVLGCGVLAMVMLRSTWQSLLAARDNYYERYRFADVFAHLTRAPDSELERLARLPGVASAYARVVENVMVPIADEPDPVTGRLISIPDRGEPDLNGLYLRAGRLPDPRSADEAVVLEQFATAIGLQLGDSLPVVIEGHYRLLRVVGIALSPEFVIALAGFEMVADNRRFVVVWMARSAIAPAFRMEGAFNDVLIRLQPGASSTAALEAIDRELVRFGGVRAVDRSKQLSNYALSSELSILRTLAVVIPAMFLGVAAFLVNVVVSRLVFLERTQIAVLKALGFTNRRIAIEYLVMVAIIVCVGAAMGTALGLWAGRWMTHLYDDFYRFPTKLFHVEFGVIAVAVGIGLVAAVAGALGAVRRVASMAPAQAMLPPAPLAYRRSLIERLGIARVLGPAGMIALREIHRRRLRFGLSALGIAMGVAIFVMGRFSYDSFDHLMDESFPRQHREDMTVVFAHAKQQRAVRELEHIPGVLAAEGIRTVPIRIRVGSRWRDSAITGLVVPSAMRLLLDHGTPPIRLPDQGLVITDRLATLLGVEPGDLVDVELLEGDFSRRRLPIAGEIDEPFGLLAYASYDWLESVLGESPHVSSALLQIDEDRLSDVRAHLKQLPAVLSVNRTAHVIERYRAQTGSAMVVMTLILTLSAAAICVGVVYNNARIAVSMRGRDLATLRVLGFTRREISTILLGELGAQVVVGIPLGLWIGRMMSVRFAASIDPEAVRFPLFISSKTYAAAALIGLVSAGVSALLVRRKLDRLDLVAVLKASE